MNHTSQNSTKKRKKLASSVDEFEQQQRKKSIGKLPTTGGLLSQVVVEEEPSFSLSDFFQSIFNFEILPSLAFSFVQTRKQIKGNKLNFALGLGACTIVVIVVSVLLSLLSHSPVIFLRLAELQEGETDLMIQASPTSKDLFLNWTRIQSLVADQQWSEYHYSSPRHVVEDIGTMGAQQCTTPDQDPADQNWKYFSTNSKNDSCENKPGLCFKDTCGPVVSYADLLLINSAQEKIIGLGREWTWPTIEPGQCLIARSLANVLDVEQGDYIYVTMNLSYFGEIWWQFWQDDPPVSRNQTQNLWTIVILPVKVMGVYSDAKGKHGTKMSKVVIMEYETFMPTVAQYLHPNVPDDVRTNISQTDLNYYAGEVVVNYPPPRIDKYLTSDVDKVQDRAISFSSALMLHLGFNQASSSLPVLSALQIYQLLNLFLGLIFNVMLFILVLLSVILIYSLMMVSVETKTFEFGVIRMIGAPRVRVIYLLLFQAFMISVPSIIIGTGLAQGLQFLISVYFKKLTGIPIVGTLTFTSIITATVIGLSIPAFSAIFPIVAALQQNLSDAIDVSRPKIAAVTFEVERSEGSGVSVGIIVCGTVFSIFGIVINYYFPLALLSLNISLLANILFSLLIGMLLGMVLLSINFQYLLERTLVHVLLIWELAAVKQVVLKNLVAHRLRNRKTSLMYSLSLGFIIFLAIYYDINANSAQYQIQLDNGSNFLMVEAKGYAAVGDGANGLSGPSVSNNNGRVSVGRATSSDGLHPITQIQELEAALLQYTSYYSLLHRLREIIIIRN